MVRIQKHIDRLYGDNFIIGIKFGSQLIPWHVYLGFYVGIAANVYPLYHFRNTDFIKFNFMAMIAVFSLLLVTLTGLDRFIPLFRLPSEPNVRLRKNTAK